MVNKLIITFSMLLIILYLFDCGMNPVEYEKVYRRGYLPKFVFLPVRIPEPIEQAQDSMVQHLASVLQQYNQINEYIEYLKLPEEDLETTSNWPRSWIHVSDHPNGMKVSLRIWYDDDSDSAAYNWLVKLSGEDTTSGISYNNFEYIKAEMDNNGIRPVLYVYKPGIENYYIRNSTSISSPEYRSNSFNIKDEKTSWAYYIEATKVKNEKSNEIADEGHLWYTYYDSSLKQVAYYWEADGIGRWSVKEAGGDVLET